MNIRHEIMHWRAMRPCTAVSFVEKLEPETDQSDDYTVVYEAKFEAFDLEHLQIDIFLTADGFVGIGIETYQRVSARLKLASSKCGYAVGHEPGPISIYQLFAILDAASDGRLLLSTRVGLLGMGKASAILIPAEGVAVPNFAEPHWRWLKVSSPAVVEHGDAVIRYQPWYKSEIHISRFTSQATHLIS